MRIIHFLEENTSEYEMGELDHKNSYKHDGTK
jgi:hypothetical protein